MNIILTGSIGAGKSTLCRKICESVPGIRGYIRLGDDFFIFPENRKIEYFIQASGIKIGKYNINPEVFDLVASDYQATKDEHDVFVLDEFGPLEVSGAGFIELFDRVIPEKHCIAVIRSGGGLIELFQEKYQGTRFRIIEVYETNRDILVEEIVREIRSGL